MPLPSPDELTEALRAQADGRLSEADTNALLVPLLVAYEHVALHRPYTVKAVPAPGNGEGLAFEASWFDTRVLTVASRLQPDASAAMQITVHSGGQLQQVQYSTFDQAAITIARCLRPG
jgi:hypothetical protein